MRFLIPLLLIPAAALSQTGWIRVERGSRLFFKPFVKLKRCSASEVLFITSDGKVYRGKPKGKSCTIVPGKRFPSASEDILYIVLKLRKNFPPQILKSGRIDNFNVLRRGE